ncbi:MAG: restriction endonuclease subunit S [Saprospirales bacterium]|nr:restriction endonuclease subunit S [Saprospirales bacterium]
MTFQSPLAPLPEQRAIVAKIEQLFSELDHGVANLRAAKAKLDIYRQAVLKKAFEGELTRAKNIKWITLGEVCDSVEYGTSSKSSDEGLIPVLRMGNIQNGRLEWEDLKFTSDSEEIEKYRLKKGDVLFNRTNSPEHVGKTAIYKGEQEAIFAGYLIRINYKKDQVSGEYLNYFLNCHVAKKHGNKVKSFGVNQSNINGTKLKKYPFPKTTIEEQLQIVQEIESRLSVCDNILANIAEALEKAEALRQSILKKAFEGRLLSAAELAACRREADWEPAGVLLARIRKAGAGK